MFLEQGKEHCGTITHSLLSQVLSSIPLFVATAGSVGGRTRFPKGPDLLAT